MQLYPKINLERKIGFPVFFPVAEIISVSRVKFGHSSSAIVMVKTSQIFMSIAPPNRAFKIYHVYKSNLNF